MTVLPTGDPVPQVLVPHWLTAANRARLAATVRDALRTRLVHPVASIHLHDVLTELHVAAARDAVWPASAGAGGRTASWMTNTPPGLSARATPRARFRFCPSAR